MLKYEVHEADPSKGYNFPFILIYPKKMQKDVKIFVEGNNSVNYVKTDKDGNIVGYQTFEEQQQDAVAFAKTICKKEDGKTFNVAYMYQQLNQPLVIPIIERCDAEHDDEYYPQMLGRNVMLDKSSKYANLPEQVVNMVKEAKKIYKKGEELDLNSFFKQLVKNGYKRVSKVEKVGEFIIVTE